MKGQPVIEQRIFEARFEQGYRYLDSCGDVMLILEDLLQEFTNCVWMPKDMAPAGAHLQCPDLDLAIVFDSFHFVLDQQAVGDVNVDFAHVADMAFATIRGRFRINSLIRFGAREISIAGTDSIDEADARSVKHSPINGRPTDMLPPDLHLAAYEQIATFDTDDRLKGIRIATKPISKIGADLKIDERLKLPPRLLPSRQREALVEQRKRSRIRNESPQAGLLVDVDYYLIRPNEVPVIEFIRDAWQQIDRAKTYVMNERA